MKIETPVNFEFSSTDATSPGTITLSDANSRVKTLKSNERLVIYGGTLSQAKGVTKTTLFDDANNDNIVTAGEIIAETVDAGAVPAGTTISFTYLPHGRICSAGNTPKVVSSATGAVSISGVGAIMVDRTDSSFEARSI